MGWFRHWFGTPYYKLLYGHRGDAEAEAWVRAIAARWGLLPGASVLDMACGRGRHARHFAALGFRVTGADLSPEVIAEARVRAPGAEFIVHDMRHAIRGRRFDAICCLFTSLGYSEEAADDQQVLDAAGAMLVPGGRFVLDFMNAPQVLKGLVPEEEAERGGVRFRIRRALEGEVLVKRIAVEDAGRTHRFEERVRALGPERLQEMAERAGLAVEALTDGPDPVPFDPERSGRCVLWARKPAS